MLRRSKRRNVRSVAVVPTDHVDDAITASHTSFDASSFCSQVVVASTAPADATADDTSGWTRHRGEGAGAGAGNRVDQLELENNMNIDLDPVITI